MAFWGDDYETFKPDKPKKESKENRTVSRDINEEKRSHASSYRTSTSESHGGGSVNGSGSSDFSRFSWLFVVIAGAYLGISLMTQPKIEKPDTAKLLHPGPPLADVMNYSIYYTLDITSSSNPERVVRVNYKGNLLRGTKSYSIERSKYPEFYRRMDLNRDGDVDIGEVTRFDPVFEGLSKGIHRGDLESIVDRFLLRTSRR